MKLDPPELASPCFDSENSVLALPGRTLRLALGDLELEVSLIPKLISCLYDSGSLVKGICLKIMVTVT